MLQRQTKSHQILCRLQGSSPAGFPIWQKEVWQKDLQPLSRPDSFGPKYARPLLERFVALEALMRGYLARAWSCMSPWLQAGTAWVIGKSRGKGRGQLPPCGAQATRPGAMDGPSDEGTIAKSRGGESALSQQDQGLPADEFLDLSLSPLLEDAELVEILKNRPGIRSLNLAGCDRLTNVAAFAIADWTVRLKYLNIAGCTQIQDAGIIAIADQCHGLTCLNVKGCWGLTSEAFIGLGRGCQQLESLNAAECYELRDDVLRYLVTHCPRLSSLNVSGCWWLTDRACVALGKKGTSLTFVALGGCLRISDTGMEALVEHGSRLVGLDISGSAVGDRGLEIVAKKCPNLAFLQVGACRHVTDAGISALAQHCSSLKSLNICAAANITDRGLEELALKCPRLQFLDVSWCPQIGDIGIRAVAQYCKDFRSLEAYGCYRLGDPAIEGVAQNCCRLRDLNVGGIDLRDTTLWSLCQGCSELQFLRVGQGGRERADTLDAIAVAYPQVAVYRD